VVRPVRPGEVTLWTCMRYAVYAGQSLQQPTGTARGCGEHGYRFSLASLPAIYCPSGPPCLEIMNVTQGESHRAILNNVSLRSDISRRLVSRFTNKFSGAQRHPHSPSSWALPPGTYLFILRLFLRALMLPPSGYS